MVKYKVKLIEGNGYCCASIEYDKRYEYKRPRPLPESNKYHAANNLEEPKGKYVGYFKDKEKRNRILRKLGLWIDKKHIGMNSQCTKKQNT